MTYPVLNAARRVVFVVTGAAKAAIVAEVLEGPRAPEAIPAQGVAPVHGTVTWLLDEAAAGELSGLCAGLTEAAATPRSVSVVHLSGKPGGRGRFASRRSS